MDPDILLLLITVFATLSLSFLCSVLESALLSVSIPSLLDRSEGSRGIHRLLDLKQNKIDDAISAILTLNTISNTSGAALAGFQAGAIWSQWGVIVFPIILTVLIFLLSEIIPKTLGTVHAIKLAPAVGRVTHFLTLIMFPFLVMTRLVTKLIARDNESPITRGEIAAMFSLAANQGAITNEQFNVLNNLLKYDNLNVTDVMTPRMVVTMMPAKATVADLLADERTQSFSRIPLYGNDQDDIRGYILMREVLAEIAMNGGQERALASFVREPCVLPKSYSVGDALRKMTASDQHLAIVLDEYGGLTGLLTLEDLLETMLGVQIVDESDRVTSLRESALKLRDQRLAKIRKRLAQ